MTALDEQLAGFAVSQLDHLIDHHLPDLALPRVFAGHLVGADVRADLAFTLGLLASYGVEEIGGRPTTDALAGVLADVDGAATHTFFSYRIAETLHRHPGLLESFPPRVRDELVAACDSTSHLDAMRSGQLPRNYAAVLLRCESGREALGLGADPPVLSELHERTIGLLDANPGGYLDDSHSRIGRYDIYSADIYLFTEPMAERLGAVWTRGAAQALDLVDRIGATNGAAFGWGRSTGALGVCLTIEMAGLATGHGLVDDPGPWLGRAQRALDHLGAWFNPEGVIAAHQHRSTFGYRGPFRRLQMTLDCLGKLADTALALRRSASTNPGDGRFPDRDEVIRFESDRPAGAWTYRSRDLAFVLPMVGSTVSDYLPAPRNPGLFETPVDADLPTGVPVVFAQSSRYTVGGIPDAAVHQPGRLSITHEGFAASRQFEAGDRPALPGRRHADYRVDGRTLTVDEQLTFGPDRLPDAVAFQLTEAADRPLRVHFHSGGPAQQSTIDVAGLKEYRSFWSELPTVHQIDLEPAVDIRFTWSVTPKLRVLTTDVRHHYHRGVYDPLVDGGWVVDRQVSTARLFDDDTYLAKWDLLHLHWPEWFIGPDLERHRRAVDRLQHSGVRIILTAHNLVPHDKDRSARRHLPRGTQAADGVIHHSHYGRRRMEDRYPFRDDAVRVVIPHLHFGHLMAADDGVTRDTDGPIRLGILGAPRVEKDVQGVLDAFAATTRSDVELFVWSLGPDDRVPDDPRITAEPYRMVSRAEYDARLRSLDALILPFGEGDMITTGTVGDVFGAGVPALVSDWGYLAEAVGAAGIPYGNDLTAAIDGLDRQQLAAAAAEARRLQPVTDRHRVAAAHLSVLEAVGTSRL